MALRQTGNNSTPAELVASTVVRILAGMHIHMHVKMKSYVQMKTQGVCVGLNAHVAFRAPLVVQGSQKRGSSPTIEIDTDSTRAKRS